MPSSVSSVSSEGSSNLQNEWNKNIKKEISNIVYISLLRLCGKGYNNGIENSQSMLKWKETLKEMAYSSVSFPNQNICMPNDNSIDTGGKSHDIEIRIALSFYHRFKSKKRKQLDSQNLTLRVTSDLGLIRWIKSSKQLSNDLCLVIEDLYYGCDIRSDQSGLICIVTKWRMNQLRQIGKLPCPSCIKWFKGEKGLRWHQQMVHGNTHSNASHTAKIQNESLPIIVYNNKWNYHSLIKKETISKQESLDIFDILRKEDIQLFQNTIQNQNISPSTLYDKNGSTLLHWACGLGNLSLVKLLIENYHTKPDIRQKGKSSFHGRTPLHWASRNGHLSIVQYLIESHHVNVNATTSDGTTAFCWACWQGHFSILRYLYQQSCDIHKQNSFGCNATLWCAQGNTSMEIIKYLHSIHCDFTIVNANGHGFFHKAAQRGKQDIFHHVYQHLFMDFEDKLALFGPDMDHCLPSDLAGVEGHYDFAIQIADLEMKLAIQAYKTDALPKWLTKEMNQMNHIKDIARLWESKGGIKRMIWAIQESKKIN